MKLFCAVVVSLLALANSTGIGSSIPHTPMQIPDEICSAKVVFLGEASHGGGQTIRAKAEITRALITRCRFNQVAFESQMYDFTALGAPYISLNALRNAIGGLWSTTQEADTLFEELTAMANRKELRVFGIDGQLGSSTSTYTRKKFVEDLTAGMPHERARECSVLTNRLAQWTFDDANPKNAQFDQDLKRCAEDSRTQAIRTGMADRIALSNNFVRFLSFSEATYVSDRDKLMFENLQRMTSPTSKTVVWTANIHAAREAVGGVQPLASHFGRARDVVSIGFTAEEGAYCMPPCRTQKLLAPASPESLERQVASLGKQSQLQTLQLGAFSKPQPSKLLDYSSETTEQWSRLFDFVFVLPRESAPNHIRAASPQKE